MSDPEPAIAGRRPLPALRRGTDGRAHVDLRAIAALAVPLTVNSSLQAVINLTDTWFVGQISTTAMAGIAAIFWLVLFFLMLVGGLGLAVQTLVAQAQGAGRYVRAAQATWVALWGSALTLPIFAALALAGAPLLELVGLEPAVREQALAYWGPRMLGAPLGVALWAMLGFFNGISRPRTTILITLIVGLANVALNQLLVFELGMGIAGSAWATNLSMLLGVLGGFWLFLHGDLRARYRAHLCWRPRLVDLVKQFRLGLPIGLLYAADIFGIAVFQLMQVKLSQVEGAATQTVMMLTSIAYMPGVGIALAATTLVGHAIGAGDRAWARRLGNTVIVVNMALMGLIGIALAAAGPWLLPAFVNQADAQAAAVVELGTTLLWIAAGYQLFDGLNLASGFALRGAGDAYVPAALALLLSWGFFVPLAHALSFAPGDGFVDWLPQFGLGAVGGWSALLVYVILLGVALFLRWRSAAWQKIRL